MLALRARIQTLLQGHKYALFISLSSAHWQLGKSVGEIRGRRQEFKNAPLILIYIYRKAIFYEENIFLPR